MSTLPSSISIFIIASMLLLRSLVGLHPHSGQGQDHKTYTTKEELEATDAQIPITTAAYGGDYEAQRHWMELTYHLPINQWYTYDLDYWGLDYPPLTAYTSWICGYLSNVLVGEHSVAFYKSRGYEDATHKAFMRGTVLVLDFLFYFVPVWCIAASRMCRSGGSSSVGDWSNSKIRESKRDAHEAAQRQRFWCMVLALAQPAIIIIDHGHFQYNTVALGLSLSSFYFITAPIIMVVKNEDVLVVDNNVSYTKQPPLQQFMIKDNQCPITIISILFGSFLFCMALNFKQMTLYYAPSVFAYLLGRCFEFNTFGAVFKKEKEREKEKAIPLLYKYYTILNLVCVLGMVVLLSFALLWWPFYEYPSQHFSDIESNSEAALLASSLPTLTKMSCNNNQFENKIKFLQRIVGNRNQNTISSNTERMQRIESVLHVLRRQFPFQRGLFENKVANLWCAASTKPISIRKRVPEHLQPTCAALLTLILLLPGCVCLFLCGSRKGRRWKQYQQQRVEYRQGKYITAKSGDQYGDGDENDNDAAARLKFLLLGCFNAALSFFLGSFQVHEKSILLPLAPLSMLHTVPNFRNISMHSNFVSWFSIVSLWSLYPLMVVDKLTEAYWLLGLMFVILCWLHRFSEMKDDHMSDAAVVGRTKTNYASLVGFGSFTLMVALHALQATISPPTTLPDLWVVLWSIVGCLLFLLSYGYTLYIMIVETFGSLKLHDVGGVRRGVKEH